MSQSVPDSFVCWEWQRDDGGSCPFTPEVSQAIEVAYASGKHDCQVHPYTVDFTNMMQHTVGECGVITSTINGTSTVQLRTPLRVQWLT